jgi:hypothetical protein
MRFFISSGEILESILDPHAHAHPHPAHLVLDDEAALTREMRFAISSGEIPDPCLAHFAHDSRRTDAASIGQPISHPRQADAIAIVTRATTDPRIGTAPATISATQTKMTASNILARVGSLSTIMDSRGECTAGSSFLVVMIIDVFDITDSSRMPRSCRERHRPDGQYKPRDSGE